MNTIFPPRQRTRLTDLVDLAVLAAADTGQRQAAAQLLAEGVPDSVIARVLCDPPWRRRKTPGSTKP